MMLRRVAVWFVVLSFGAHPVSGAQPEPDREKPPEKPKHCSHDRTKRDFEQSAGWGAAVGGVFGAGAGAPVGGAAAGAGTVLLTTFAWKFGDCAFPDMLESLGEAPKEFERLGRSLPGALNDAADEAARGVGDLSKTAERAGRKVAEGADRLGRHTVGRTARDLGKQRDRSLKDLRKGARRLGIG